MVRRLKRTLPLLACFLYASGAAHAQKQTVPNKGWLEKGAYRNPSIGVSFTPAPGLELGQPEVKGTPPAVPFLITVSALGPERWFRAREATIFYADPLSYYPEPRRTVEAYLPRVIRANAADGFELVQGKAEEVMAGQRFLRADFVKGQVCEAVLVTTRNGYAFVFTFTGADRTAVDKLVQATKLQFDQ